MHLENATKGILWPKKWSLVNRATGSPNLSDVVVVCWGFELGWEAGTISATGCGWAWRPAKRHENQSLDRMAVLGAARSRLAMEQARPSNCLTRSVRDCPNN